MFCTEKLLSAPVVNNISDSDSFLNGFGHAVNVSPSSYEYCAFAFFIVHKLSL